MTEHAAAGGGVVSSNTLFHFTKSYDALLGILENDFEPRFCLEDYSCIASPDGGFAELEVAFPMICFCDLPLSQIGSHLATYGDYGIGLTKEWGQRNGLNPVLYIHGKSRLWNAIDALLDDTINSESEAFTPAERNLMSLITFVKPYSGRFWRNGQYLQNVRFYDEREWRFVPDLQYGEGSLVLSKDGFLMPETREAANSKFRDKCLSFAPSDVRYIIVENETEVLPMVNAILRIKGDKYSHNDLQLLTTRIISAQQIRQDF